MTTIFTAAPFDHVDGAKPQKPTLRATIAERRAPAKPSAVHVPPKAPKEPPVTVREPTSVEDAKAQMAALSNLSAECQVAFAKLSGVPRTDPRRLALVERLNGVHAAQRTLKLWLLQNANNPLSTASGAFFTPILRGLVDALNRAEDAGHELTDEEQDVLDKAAWWLHKNDPEFKDGDP